MGRPVAYIRRSVSRRNDPGDLSRQFQTEKVRELANGDGGSLTVIDQDWGRSAAGDKTDKRLAFLGLLDAVERGEVSTLYAYSADRLARSVRWSAQLLDACEAAGTTIVTGEGRFAPRDDMARQMFHFQAMQNEGALRQMTTKAKAWSALRESRGDKLGRAPYGYRMARDAEGRVIHALDPSQPLEPVLEAFQEAGSFAGAARLLNERGVPAPLGRSWSGNVVGKVVRREAPHELAGRRVERRVRVKGNFTLARVLVCACGQTMTGRTSMHQTKYGTYGPYVSYVCFRGRYEPDHPRPYVVSERVILPAIQAEVARLRVPADRVQLAEADALERNRLEAERERLGWDVVKGVLSAEALRERAAEIRDAIDAIDRRGRAVDIPTIDWSWSPRALNDVLTALFVEIRLDTSMQPVAFEWVVPEWRRG
jgi:DNA invertase Pin-like site-specific DNA recombinase